MKMVVGWVRGEEEVGFTRPHTYFCIGVRGSGKSRLLENIGEGYLSEGHVVLDLYGSRDGEGLAWLRSQYAKDKRILVIHGDNVSVQGSFEFKSISKVSLSDFENHDIIVSSSPLYTDQNDEYLHMNRLIDVLYSRLEWKNMVYMITRESANLFYSRLRVSPNQLAAKAETTYLIREARHCGIALGLDTLKFTSIDSDIRVVVDHFLFKSQGQFGFPSDMQWLYGYFNPAIVRNMPPQYYFIVTAKGAVGIGVFPDAAWHKQERENILRSVGLKVERGDRMDYPQDRGTYKTVGDEEHLKIIDEYFEGSSMGKIAKKLKRSAATIHAQIQVHNEAMQKNGYCIECRRSKGKHETENTNKRIT